MAYYVVVGVGIVVAVVGVADDVIDVVVEHEKICLDFDAEHYQICYPQVWARFFPSPHRVKDL